MSVQLGDLLCQSLQEREGIQFLAFILGAALGAGVRGLLIKRKQKKK